MGVSGLLDKEGYTLQDVMPLVRVKPHVLRYWEQMLPLIRSGRDEGGHRVWTAGQLRMLLRVRHLVVERGVAVTAAGDALLREAAGDSAQVKAGLEGVRDALAATLLRLRNSSGPGEGLRPPALEGANPGDPSRVGVSLEQLIAQGVLPLPDDEKSGGGYPPLPVVSPAIPEREGVRLVYSHLFARGAPEAVARALAALVRYRLSQESRQEDPVPLVVAVPWGCQELYRQFFPEETFLLPVPPLRYRQRVCCAPTLAVLLAVASSRDLDLALRRWERETIHIWAADSPHSIPQDTLSPRARETSCGVVLGVRAAPSGYRLTESAAIHLEAWRPHLEKTLRCGRWVRRPPKKGPLPGEFSSFRLWLRDLSALEGAAVLVSAGRHPGVWRGSSWLEQVRLVWGEAPFSGFPGEVR
ncbi:DNA-binding transcriptional regulator, MerR family [Alkalispirochaeta americana]|uniref:DNA-binding transcriptional regulator, MerR family n=1 Tax=Alkalispirochaeta americana TaxID=159291 RepID=A0A1N6W0P2_9SPIO|nr:MerR family transcriptional regulator [Alkalispirochaeta americana]SIQ83699.1 DNA-binding transcriptional regulator, MerR family [Alkalispirochaeta americana]